ncbi:hypothetical protein K439DRAFT_953025 [Ramaria rubella]|nr:hypothetical protein K439DRAFT_953025 [Ramaria rubella]
MNDERPLLGSFVPPHTYWTPIDKAKLFQSLGRHSRWNPDIIAEDIGGGKTVAEVCSYLELLEQASAKHSRKRNSDGFHREEEQSLQSSLKRKRNEEVKKAKHALREGFQEETSSDEDMANEGDDDWRSRFETRKQELTVSWKRDKFLSSLGERYLKTMDIMIRDVDPVDEKQTIVEHSRQPDDATHDHDTHIKYSTAHQRPNLDTNITTDGLLRSEPLESHVSNSQIDPSLLALDLASAGSDAQPTSPSCAPDCGLNAMASSSPLPGPQPVSEDMPSVIVPEIPHNLSPASRRRLRKRLWARRKRAQESGLPASEVSMELTKLKRGRKAKSSARAGEEKECIGVPVESRPLDPGVAVQDPLPSVEPVIEEDGPPVVNDESQEEDKEENTDSDASESARARKPYGWSNLQTLEINETMLRAHGLDVFHLSKLASLMSLIGAIHMPVEPDEGLSALSYPFLRLLRACLAHFLTCLVGHVIVHKEIETCQKRRIHNIFRTGGAKEIRTENVHEVLELMRHDTSTKPFFKRLKREMQTAILEQSSPDPGGRPQLANADAAEESGAAEGESDGEDVPPVPPLSNPMPGKGLPPSYGDRHARSGLFWNPNTPATFVENDEEDLLSDIDESALLRVLRAEEELERADFEADRIYERALWDEIGFQVDTDVVPTEGDSNTNDAAPELEGAEETTLHQDEVIVTEGGGEKSLRFRKPGGAVKSRAYIDSDDDV